MTPEDYLKAGNLKESLQLLQERIKKQPSNSADRIFLFQLLSVMGQWERAQTQLKVLKELDERSIPMVLIYRQVIACEQYREQVFLGQQEPVIFGKPKKWIALLVQALRLTAERNYEASRNLRTQAFEEAASNYGTINGESFAWIADSDPRIGPILEAYIDGRYLWIAWESIRSIVIEEPVDLRDVVWLPAHFTWINGGESYGLLPTRYPFSYQIDPQLALSRKTIWEEYPYDLCIAYGQRMWTTDQSEYALMDTRAITITPNSEQDKE